MRAGPGVSRSDMRYAEYAASPDCRTWDGFITRSVQSEIRPARRTDTRPAPLLRPWYRRPDPAPELRFHAG